MVSHLRIIGLTQGAHKKTDILRIGIHKLKREKKTDQQSRPPILTIWGHTEGIEQRMKGYFQWDFMDDWSGSSITSIGRRRVG